MKAINKNRDITMCNGISKNGLKCALHFKYGCKRAANKLQTTHYECYFIELPLIKTSKGYECDYYIPVDSNSID